MSLEATVADLANQTIPLLCLLGIGIKVATIIVGSKKQVRKKVKHAKDVLGNLDDSISDLNKEVRLVKWYKYGGGFSDWIRDKWK